MENLPICYKCEKEPATKEYGDVKHNYKLCAPCYESCEDKTGYCSLECQVFGQCDWSC
jgi:hypothetical protein